MFTKPEIIEFFPTCLWVREVADSETLNRHLIDGLGKLQQAAGAQPGRESVWQSPSDLHARPGFEALDRYFLAAARSVLKFLKCTYDDCYITDCWANINRKGHAHTMHTHPNNFLSGVYYVKTPARSGRIVFGDPRPAASAITPTLAENTRFNSNEMSFEPEDGKLILFNSWLPHFVELNRSEEERISIAFNVMLKGHLGVAMASAEV
jgi:uncharacterized protein (TIGR02466 family)